MSRLNEIEEELLALEQRRESLLVERKNLLAEKYRIVIHNEFTPAEKIELFLSRFACRTDVYPRLWENTKDGRKGYSPVCANEWSRLICEKPRIKCSDCMHQAFPPLDEVAARNHLTGKSVIGTYAIRLDHSCIFLAADFDEGDWHQDILAYKKAAEKYEIHVAIERSRSGNGGHAWIFFSEPIAAALARKMGTVLLSEALKHHPFLSLKSYDRLFPNQDQLAPGGFGNLIALPLQEKARKLGNSVFVDDNFTPLENQWGYLAAIPLCSPDVAETIVSAVHENADSDEIITFEEKALDKISSVIHEGTFKGTVHAELLQQLTINTKGLPRELIAALKRLGTISNPVFYEKQRLRLPTYLIPRLIFCGQLYPEKIILPRGLKDKAQELVKKAGALWHYNDKRNEVSVCEFTFSGELYADQQIAINAMLQHDHGVLLAPPGSGKTVMACAIISARKTRTLILVHRKPLMEQWIERISAFLSLDKKSIGVWGSKKCKSDHAVVIAMIQSAFRNPTTMFDDFGQVIIDECHHLPAASFEAVMKERSARFILGLTATPQRKDGLQKILFLQCGPIRHQLIQSPDTQVPRHLIVRHMRMNWHDEYPLVLHEIWDRLIKNQHRNEIIVNDVIQCLQENRSCALLSDRKEHLEILAALLKNQLIKLENIFQLTGATSAKLRRLEMEKIDHAISEKKGFLLMATSSLVGEGFDLPALDTLLLAMPISFRGRLIQYAGRIHRANDSKTDSKIFDYTEDDVPISISMFRKRIQAYRLMGYRMLES